MSKKRIVIGLSGGVDSSVAAYLCVQAGYDVVGLFMNNWEEKDGTGVCTAANDWADASAVAAKLGIPCYSVNFAEEYMDKVFAYFLAEYKAGRTPNPDVLCNREIKFGPFLEEAKKLGAELVATGHYAGVAGEGSKKNSNCERSEAIRLKNFSAADCFVADASRNDEKKIYRLVKAADQSKDQTYFLNQLRQGQLAFVYFPLADIKKEEVRRIATQLNLVTANKRDSTGICFIGERKFKKFLSQYLPAQHGVIVDTAGREVGRHEGLMYYTVGQRRGLDIGGRAGYAAERWFVVSKDLKENRLIVSCGECEELLSKGAVCGEFNWIGISPSKAFTAKCKFRYRQDEQAVTVELLPDGKVKITALEQQRALTPGQWAVLYDGKYCLGGGVMLDILN